MARVLLDTTVLIDVLRGRPAGTRLRALLDAGDTPCICAVNVEEVVRGVRDQELAATSALLEGMRVIPLRSREGWLAGQWRASFAARGITLGQGDCLVAAAALAVGGRLATGNPRDFPMAELSVEDWPVGA